MVLNLASARASRKAGGCCCSTARRSAYARQHDDIKGSGDPKGLLWLDLNLKHCTLSKHAKIIT